MRLLSIALLLATATALPSWLKIPFLKSKHEKAVERVLDNFKRDEFYGALGAKPKDSPKKLKAAYKEMAKKVHPDKNPDSRAAETRAASSEPSISARWRPFGLIF